MLCFRKMICLLLALCVCIASTTAVTLATDSGMSNFDQKYTYIPGQFSDVDESAWYAENVKFVYESGLMLGKGDGTFDPNAYISIAELAAIAARIYSIYHTDSDEFPERDPWYMAHWDYLEEVGILPPGDGDIEWPARRWHVTLFLQHALPESELPEINQVEDHAIPDIVMEHYGNDAVYRFYRAGIMKGSDEQGTFRQYDNVTRAEVAAVVSRMLDPTLRMSFTLPNVED